MVESKRLLNLDCKHDRSFEKMLDFNIDRRWGEYMRTKLEEVESYENEIAIIRAVKLTEEICCAIDMLESNRSMIPVIEKNQITMCPTTAIYYIESIEKKTFIYTK